MTEKEIIIEKFIETCDEILFTLRAKGSLEQSSMEEMIKLLQELGSIYSNDELIPKSIAGVLFDLSTALYSAADHMNTEKKKEAFKIFDQFCEVARELLN